MSYCGTSIAVISDVHGNRWALDAVLEDIQKRGIRHIVNLGDSLYGPLAPAETADILLRLNIPTVRGNEDRLIVDAPTGVSNSPTLSFVRNQLTQVHLDWMAGLETTTVSHSDFRLFHGSPDRDDEYLLQKVSIEGVKLIEPHMLITRLAHMKEPVILCGHDHVPRIVRLPDGKLIVNPGSVGLQAYTDDVPCDHAMETGSPDARYSIVHKEHDDWQALNMRIPYDWKTAAEAASQNAHPDWAQWLRTGRASPR